MYEDLILEGWIDEDVIVKFLAGAPHHPGEELREIARKLSQKAANGEYATLQGKSVSLATMKEAARRLEIFARNT